MFSESAGAKDIIERREYCMYIGPADIVGQVSGVQNSVTVPYRMFT